MTENYFCVKNALVLCKLSVTKEESACNTEAATLMPEDFTHNTAAVDNGAKIGTLTSGCHSDNATNSMSDI